MFQVAIDFIGTVDVERKIDDVIQIEYGNAMAFESPFVASELATAPL